MDQYWRIVINALLFILSRLPLFWPNVLLSVSRSRPGQHSTFSHRISLGFSRWLVFQTYFLLTWLCDKCWLGILQNVLWVGSVCCFCFHRVRVGLWVSGRKTTEVVSFSSHLIKCTCYQPDFLLSMLTLIAWLRLCLLGFRIIKLLFRQLFIVFGRESLCTAQTYGVGG